MFFFLRLQIVDKTCILTIDPMITVLRDDGAFDAYIYVYVHIFENIYVYTYIYYRNIKKRFWHTDCHSSIWPQLHKL